LKRNVALLIGGVVALWAVSALPARALWGDEALVLSGIAALICLVPGVLTLVWCQKSIGGPPEQRLLAVMGGTMTRMFVVVAAGFLLYYAVPALHEPAFLIWVVVFYLVTLAIEVTLVVKELSATNPPPQGQ
jgi:hypothetical protein